MTIAKTVEQYLEQNGVEFGAVAHPASPTASHTAQSAHVSGELVAKGVLLKDDQGFVLAVLPATRELDLDRLNGDVLNRSLVLCEEAELGEVFTDCDLGAVPAVGPAYGLETIVDSHTTSAEEVYFEAGDHRTLLKVKSSDFRDKLLKSASEHEFSHHLP